eukprot:Sspe_Gene.76524::Locus_47819_Transcript_2_2_Confidence_0.400_Length_1612::g.76524::m.76524/K14803/PTC2_3; protein phosphatase PTC2/3
MGELNRDAARFRLTTSLGNYRPRLKFSPSLMREPYETVPPSPPPQLAMCPADSLRCSRDITPPPVRGPDDRSCRMCSISPPVIERSTANKCLFGSPNTSPYTMPDTTPPRARRHRKRGGCVEEDDEECEDVEDLPDFATTGGVFQIPEDEEVATYLQHSPDTTDTTQAILCPPIIGHSYHVGSRSSLEDVCVNESHQETTVAILCDGHGGAKVAHKVAKLVPRILLRHADRPAEELPRLIAQALVSADHMLYTKEAQFQREGTTVTVVVVTKDHKVVVGHIGDSRVVACDNKKAVQLTRDHKLRQLWDEEMVRLNSFGGVFSIDGLEVTRALGDFALKEGLYNGQGIKGCALSNRCEVSEMPVTDSTPFLVLASDGLWDVMDNQYVISWFLEYFRTNPCYIYNNLHRLCGTPGHHYTTESSYLAQACKELADHAVRDKLSNDNVTVLLVLLHPIEQLTNFKSNQDILPSPTRCPWKSPVSSIGYGYGYYEPKTPEANRSNCYASH